jgi:cytidine deaminase
MTDSFQTLLNAARTTRENAYCPYSGHKVGAALLTAEGQIFSGCNIENSSYGATICAERVAIQNAISEKGRVSIVEMVIVTEASPPWPPCGMCRQVLAEFSPNTLIFAVNLLGECKKLKLNELLPDAFTPAHLGKK